MPPAGQTFSTPGLWDSRNFERFDTWRRYGFQPYAPDAFTPLEKFLELISVRDWVEPRATVRPEGLDQCNIPMIPSGIVPASFRLASQCLNQPLRQMAEYTWKSRSPDRTSNAEPSKCAALTSHKFYTAHYQRTRGEETKNTITIPKRAN